MTQDEIDDFASELLLALDAAGWISCENDSRPATKKEFSRMAEVIEPIIKEFIVRLA